MNEDDKARKLIDDPLLYNEIDERLKKPSRNAEEEALGALNNVIDSGSIEVDIEKRKSIEVGLLGIIAASFNLKNATSIYSPIVATVSAGIGIANYNINNKTDWKIRRGLANKIGLLTYDSQKFDELRADNSINSGEAALIDSFLHHRDYRFEHLINNLEYLQRAAEENNDTSVRSLVLSRIAIDNNALSRGGDARAAIEKINIEDISDYKIREMVLDNATAVAFNSINENDFLTYSGVPVSLLRRGWQKGGMDPLEQMDRDIFQRLGINSFAALQIKLASDLQTSQNIHECNKVRRDFIAQAVEAVKANNSSENILHISKDFMFTLTRAAYHALYCNDSQHLHELIEIYFGRREFMIGNDNLTEARRQIISGNSPNMQWMMLLDALVNGLSDRDSREKQRYIHLLSGFDIANSTLARTVPLLSERFNISAKKLILAPHYKKWSRSVQMSMHRAYFFGINQFSKKANFPGKI